MNQTNNKLVSENDFLILYGKENGERKEGMIANKNQQYKVFKSFVKPQPV